MGRGVGAVWRPDGILRSAVPRTVSELGQDEAFLERIVAGQPELLGLDSKATGIHGPFVPFRQTTFHTPLGRQIRPDIVFLSASGHPVIVEVKLYDNPELRDRRVISQVVDYAASFTALDPKELLAALSPGEASWPTFIERTFPDEDAEELADALVHRFAAGELTLVIVCDRVPSGLHEAVEGIASQSALAFDLTVVELQPFVVEGDASIFFTPHRRIETEIVARTVVTVTLAEGSPVPGIRVTVDSPQRIGKALETARGTSTGARRGRSTVANDAVPLLDERLQDLIAASSIGATWVWRGFDVVSEVSLPVVDRAAIEVMLDSLVVDADSSQRGYKIRIVLRGKARVKKRLQHLVSLLRSNLARDPIIGGSDLVVEGNAIHWPKSLPDDFEITAEQVADLVAPIFRMLAEKLSTRMGAF